MLLLLNAGVEGVGIVAGEDGDFGLGEDGASVDAFVDEMNGAAGLGVAAFEGLPPGAEAGVFGQEGRVNVEDATGEG